MTTFKHKDIDIRLDHSGAFVATVDGKTIVKPSLAAMKKFLDKPAEFTAFDALIPADNDAGFIEMRVTGKTKSQRRGYGTFFEIASRDNPTLPSGSRHFVYADTAAHRDTLRAIAFKREAIREINRKYQQEIDELQTKLPQIVPE